MSNKQAGANGNQERGGKVPAVKGAQAAVKNGEPAQAVQIIRRALEQPEAIRKGAWGLLAHLAGDLRDSGAAVQCAMKNQEEDPRDLNRVYQLSHYLIEFGRDEKALEVLTRLEKQNPGYAKLKLRAAVALAHLGRFDEARAKHEEILELEPNSAESWYQLAVLKGLSKDEGARFDRFMDVYRAAGDSDPKQTALFEFALGVMNDRAGDTDSSFEHFSKANRLFASTGNYDPARVRQFADASRQAHSAEAMAKGAEQGRHDSTRPIFVAGTARSGTTLLERLLSAHSGVAGGGELGALRVAGYPIEGRAPDQVAPTEQPTPSGDRSSWRALGDFHLRLLTERFGSEGKVVDKAIFVPFRMGFILALYENAPVIWTRRDPRDVAWSIFQRRLFQQDWSWNMEHIASRIVEVERFEDHFSAIAPERILNVRYEDLAANPGEWTDRILEHCGLPHEAVEETFHQQDGPVATASVESVREPISTKSIGSWRRYEKHMGEFIEAYRKFGGREAL